MDLKNLATAISALVVVVPAYSAEQAWTFGYDHLVFVIGGESFDRSVSGSFVADDIDSNGTLTLPELKSFVMDGRIFSPEQLEGFYWDGYTNWQKGSATSAFTFDGGLHFSGSWYGYKTQTQYVISSTEYSQRQDIAGSNGEQTYWGPQTTFTIASVSPPIPEPAPAVLLLSGGALLATLRWRRRSGLGVAKQAKADTSGRPWNK